MYSMSNPITPPVVVVTSQTYESYNIMQTFINLGSSATFLIQILDDSGSIAKTQSLTMEGADYLAWGSNDAYVYQWINSQLQILK